MTNLNGSFHIFLPQWLNRYAGDIMELAVNEANQLIFNFRNYLALE